MADCVVGTPWPGDSHPLKLMALAKDPIKWTGSHKSGSNTKQSWLFIRNTPLLIKIISMT